MPVDLVLSGVSDPTPELFVPHNLLEQCLGLQELIAQSPPDEKDRTGQEVRDMISDDDLHFHGARRLEISTSGAFALPDGMTVESSIWPVIRYGELQLKGSLAQVAYMRLQRIATLTWMITQPTIRHDRGALMLGNASPDLIADEEASLPLPIGKPLHRPLYLPVGMITNVLAAV